MLGVHPKLIDQMCSGYADIHGDWHAEKKAWNIKHPGSEKAGAGLAQSCAQVVVFTLMMDHMRAPEKLSLMTHTVKPVIEKVIQQDSQQPMAEGGTVECPNCVIFFNARKH